MILESWSTQLGGSSTYGAGAYSAGVYGEAASNAVVMSPTPGSVWVVDGILTATESQSFTQFVAYLNTFDPTGLLGTTIDGNLDEMPIPELRMVSSDIIIGIWYGGDPGSIATAGLDGDVFIPE